MNGADTEREQQVMVVCFFADGLVREGEVTVTGGLLERFNSGNPFVPLHGTAERAVWLRRQALTHLRCAADAIPLPAASSPWAVQISFAGNELLSGTLALPAAVTLGAGLAALPAFFPLYNDEDCYLVNRDRVRDILPLARG